MAGVSLQEPAPPVAAVWIVAQDGAAYYLESEPTLETDEEGEDPRDGCREEGGVLTGASADRAIRAVRRMEVAPDDRRHGSTLSQGT